MKTIKKEDWTKEKFNNFRSMPVRDGIGIHAIGMKSVRIEPLEEKN
jgi:hypothetical protein